MINGTKTEETVPQKTSQEEEGASIPAGEESSFRLTEERRKMLEEVGFVWSTKDAEKQPAQPRVARSSYDDLWDANFKKLLTFREKHGHCLVPKRFAGKSRKTCRGEVPVSSFLTLFFVLPTDQMTRSLGHGE